MSSWMSYNIFVVANNINFSNKRIQIKWALKRLLRLKQPKVIHQ